MIGKRWMTMVVGSIAAVALPALPARGQAREPAPAAPVARLNVMLDAFHVRDGRPGEQMEVVHFCSQVSPDLHQCALFDGTGRDARLLGVEYVISEKAMRALPGPERALWHSHAYEVKSGQLYAPGKSAADQQSLMKTLAGTYGKTWHTWDMTQSAAVPLGRPALMMAFTRDGQIQPGLVEQRDRHWGMSTRGLCADRDAIKPPTLVAGVDRGEGGRSCLETSERQPVKGGGSE